MNSAAQHFPTSGTDPVPDSPNSADGRHARWENHRTQRRIDLIRSARDAVHTLGPEASMGDIAAAAGTSKSVFYRYFKDKGGLQQAMSERVLDQMQRRIRDAVSRTSSAEDGLRAMVSAYLHLAQTSPNVYAFVTQDSPASPGSAAQGEGPALFGHFFKAITDMISEPLTELLGSENALLQYWPAAAIGLVRASGEQWLRSSRDGVGAAADSADVMAERITGWLVDGIRPSLESAHTTTEPSEDHQKNLKR